MVDMAAQAPSQFSGSGTTIASLHGTNYQDAINHQDLALQQTMSDLTLTQQQDANTEANYQMFMNTMNSQFSDLGTLSYSMDTMNAPNFPVYTAG